MPIWPLRSPPLNQIWFPPSPLPLRKLQTVQGLDRDTAEDLDPVAARPPGPEVLIRGRRGALREPGFVGRRRRIPRTVAQVDMFGVVISTPAARRSAGESCSRRARGNPPAQSGSSRPGRAASTAAWMTEWNCGAAVPGLRLWPTRRTLADAAAVKASETPKTSPSPSRQRFQVRLDAPIDSRVLIRLPRHVKLRSAVAVIRARREAKHCLRMGVVGRDQVIGSEVPRSATPRALLRRLQRVSPGESRSRRSGRCSALCTDWLRGMIVRAAHVLQGALARLSVGDSEERIGPPIRCQGAHPRLLLSRESRSDCSPSPSFCLSAERVRLPTLHLPPPLRSSGMCTGPICGP